MNDRQLLDMAREAAGNSYSPYSKFPVGAALECADGTIYTGCNIENAALGSTICAERVAVCKAVSEGQREFTRIAIWGESENYCMPCGACRQFLVEFSPDIEVLCSKAGGRYVSYPLSKLMPYSFNY
ncbi:MAG: cytidine deaminase [Oscillospiraceae bacterium]|nr:cytidine deaminase [Oscillospiraceae bacterium]MCD7792166.1 cytidine deaminase [Oscillospiraceae bacterium]MCD8099117.1 cytidine deaminase [Oscillospiraceae bacterium]MCD8254597.1 cytidine deaminase [Oscillospiraceae bacterium]MCD8343163.1 cytidine deaminase [Oscillospiraceae bacterium]